MSWSKRFRFTGAALAIVTLGSGISTALREDRNVPTVARQVFFNIPDALFVAFYLTVSAALFVCLYLFAQRALNWERGRPEQRNTKRGERINKLYRTLMMKTVAEDKKFGVVHGLIYWSFLVLTAATITLEVDHQLPANLRFLHGTVYEIYSLISDIAGVLLIVGILAAAWRRYVFPPRRIAKKTKPEDAIILLLLLSIAVTGLLVEAVRIASFGRPDYEQYSIAGMALSHLFNNVTPALHQSLWTVHVGLFIAFLIVLPTTKLRHAVTTPINSYYSPRERPFGEAPPVPNLLETEVDSVGVSKVEEFTWKQLLDTDACTICGRCTDVCPANQTGKKLDPREIVLKVGSVMAETTPGGEISSTVGIPVPATSITDLITPEEVFACTTCRACDEVCPAEIEIMDKIIDVRRHYTLMETEFPSELNMPFLAMENSSNPWAMSQSSRADWTQEVDFDIPIVDGTEPFSHEVLYWVGCAGSFDDRNKQVTLAVAKLLHNAGVDFAILGPNEMCTGDPARRSGNEYLFQMLATQNVELLNGMGTQKIVAQCPHCFNTLANEYTEFGGNYDVVHHSQLISELLDNGRLKLGGTDGEHKLVYHDSCYLGRHNGEFSAPRKVVGSLKGISLVEAEQSGSNGMCCGAGGARMWMEENVGERINSRRLGQLTATGADEIATACPFCYIMLDDASRAEGSEIPINDIAVTLAKRIEN